MRVFFFFFPFFFSFCFLFVRLLQIKTRHILTVLCGFFVGLSVVFVSDSKALSSISGEDFAAASVEVTEIAAESDFTIQT